MKALSTRLLALLAASLLLSLGAACGDSAGDDDDDDDMSVDAGDDDDDGGSGLCPTHANVSEMSGVCAVTGGENSPVTDDLTLTADVEWLLNGPVFIGDDTNETILTIEAGTTIYGGDGSFLLIQRGSKIMASGTASDPIVMTSAKEVGTRGPEDWGGLVINGRATINNGDASGEAPGEAGSGTYGGNDDADDSGTITYLRVEFAGNKVDAENELNGIAFQGVGSGTTVEYVQTHLTSDDGVEFFGGTVSVKHLVVTGSDDDSIDWTGGWRGNIQFALVEQLADSGPEANHGIEADNLEGDHTATPASSPTLSNITFIARSGNTSAGVRFRRGTGVRLYNSIITGFDAVCVQVQDQESLDKIGDDLVVDNVVLDCTDTINAEASDLTTGANIVEMDPDLDGWMPNDGSPALGIGDTPASGAFFDDADYAGAIGTTDWTSGWTTSATN